MKKIIYLSLLLVAGSAAAQDDCELLKYDGNGDGTVNYEDFLEMLAAFGTSDLDGDCIEDSEDPCVCGPCLGFEELLLGLHSYELIEIGEQCWFAENLRTETYANGDTIVGGLTNAQWSSADYGAQSVYGNDSILLEQLGRLYNWYAVNDARGLCPNGWHVPSDDEMKILELELGMSPTEVNQSGFRGSDQGTQTKASPEDSLGWNGTNESGFTFRPGGYRHEANGGFYGFGSQGQLWTSTPNGTFAWNRTWNTSNTGISRDSNYDFHGFGLSVRCLKD